MTSLSKLQFQLGNKLVYDTDHRETLRLMFDSDQRETPSLLGKRRREGMDCQRKRRRIEVGRNDQAVADQLQRIEEKLDDILYFFSMNK